MKKFNAIIIIFSMFFILSGCELLNQPVDPNDPIISKVNIEPFERIFNDEIVKSLTISITEEEWTGLNDAMISYAEQFGGDLRTDYYARANLVYEDELGEVEIADIGLRTRGNLSRVLIQNPDDDSLNMSNFKISFDEDFDLTELAANKKRTVFELEELDMKFNRNYDPTYLTEKFSLDLFKDFGVYAAHTTLANINIKIGDTLHYYGVYTLFEPIDKNFLQRRMTDEEAEGNLYKCLWQQFMPASLQPLSNSLELGMKDVSANYRPTYDLKTNEKTGDTSDLLYFIDQINTLNDVDFVQFIDDHFNVDMFLRYLATGVLLGNPDDYRAMGNNYYFYHNDVLDEWTMIPYDYDHGLAQGWTGDQVFSNYTVGTDIYEWGNLNKAFLGRAEYPHPLVDRILNISKYQVLYESYLSDLVNPENNLFSYDHFLSVYNMQKGLYDDMVSEAMMNLRFDLRNIEWYINAKVADIEDQLAFYALNPELRGY